MTLIPVVLVALLIGYFSRRWLVLFLGPVAGAYFAGSAVLQHQSPWDTPSVIAFVATAAIGAGVALGRTSKRRSTA
jgi:hypothetical protein